MSEYTFADYVAAHGTEMVGTLLAVGAVWGFTWMSETLLGWPLPGAIVGLLLLALGVAMGIVMLWVAICNALVLIAYLFSGVLARHSTKQGEKGGVGMSHKRKMTKNEIALSDAVCGAAAVGVADVIRTSGMPDDVKAMVARWFLSALVMTSSAMTQRPPADTAAGLRAGIAAEVARKAALSHQEAGK